MKRWAFVVVFGFAVVACQAQKAKVHSLEERKAPADVKQSFDVQQRIETKPVSALPGAPKKTHLIRLQKTSLGKVFLMIASARDAATNPQWQDFAPMAVSFEQSGDTLGLFELKQAIYSEIKNENLLGTFKIVEETDQDVAFEWTVGLNSLPMRTPYKNSLSAPSAKELEDQGIVDGFNVKDSFVRSASLENNNLHIEQVSRVTSPSIVTEGLKAAGAAGQKPKIVTAETTYAIDLQIRPYVENKNFQKRTQDPRRRADFFALTTQNKESSETTDLIMHWDLSPERGPINVVFSPATPAEYRDAMKEGVLYWNRVIGREVLKVNDQGSADVPADRTIIVRWIPFSDAGFAYAKTQADPFTGESLRAQIYMTSSWVQMDFPKADAFVANQQKNLLKGKDLLCFLQPSDLFNRADSLTGVRTLEEKRDTVRTVIAHEMGHIMGLRHNFAGTMGTPLSTEDVFKQTVAYRADSEHATGAPVSSTVMDYHPSAHDLVLGRWIKSNVLPYDQMTMSYLETGKLSDKIAPFCSDEELMAARVSFVSLYDCSQGDWGTNPYISARLNTGAMFRLMLIKQIDDSYAKMFPKDLRKGEALSDDETAKAIEGSKFEVSFLNLMSFRSTLYTNVTSSGTEIDNLVSFATMKKKTPDFDPYTQTLDINGDADLKPRLKADLAAAGGYAAILKAALHVTPDLKFDLAPAKAALDDVLASYPFKKGKTTEGVEYELTDDQVVKLKASVRKAVTEHYVDHLASVVTAFLPGPTAALNPKTGSAELMTAKLRPDLVSDEDSKAVAELAAKLITANGAMIAIKGIPGNPSVGVPAMPPNVRLALSLVFNSQLWNAKIPDDLKKQVRDSIQARIDLIKSITPETPSTTPLTPEQQASELQVRVLKGLLTQPELTAMFPQIQIDFKILELLK